MNKKMRELYKKMQDKLSEVKNLTGDGDTEKGAALMDDLDKLQKEFEFEKRVYDAEKGIANSSAPDKEGGAEKSGATGFGVISKMLRGKPLDDDEKALISGTDAVSGENYLIPADVDTTIRELRKSYISAKDIVTVIPTASLTGSFTFESGTPAGLTSFDDGDAITTGANPTFVNKPWNIALKGMIIPVSNVLSLTEKAGLTAYLNRWFVKNAIISENADIFACLKADKAAVVIGGWEALKTSINVDLDPSCLIDGVIVTNQTGFNYLDSKVDTNNRPILQPDPSNATKKLFQGLPIKVFTDGQLANVNGAAPVFYGNTKAGAYFIDLLGYMFAASEHAGFGTNATHLRVIEGYALVGADKTAYCYGLMKDVEAAG